MPDRDHLLRTPYGRYRAGVLIKPDGYGGQVAEVLVPFGPSPAGEIEVQVALKLPAEPTFELAAMKAREWALEYNPRVFEIDEEDLDVELLKRAEFR